MNSNIINLVGSVTNPPSTSLPDQSTPMFSSGRQAESLVSEVHGKYYAAAYRGAVFHAQVDGVAILKVIATGVVNVLALWNPTSSGVIAELISTDVATVAAATIVDAYGWYRSTSADAAAATFTTVKTAVSGRVGDTAANKMLAYSALTLPNSAAPIRIDLIGGIGAITNTVGSIRKEYNGSLLVMPGTLLSLLASTTDSTATGDSAAVSWCEWPV
jgi:hypothetical protein